MSFLRFTLILVRVSLYIKIRYVHLWLLFVRQGGLLEKLQSLFRPPAQHSYLLKTTLRSCCCDGKLNKWIVKNENEWKWKIEKIFLLDPTIIYRDFSEAVRGLAKLMCVFLRFFANSPSQPSARNVRQFLTTPSLQPFSFLW